MAQLSVVEGRVHTAPGDSSDVSKVAPMQTC